MMMGAHLWADGLGGMGCGAVRGIHRGGVSHQCPSDFSWSWSGSIVRPRRQYGQSTPGVRSSKAHARSLRFFRRSEPADLDRVAGRVGAGWSQPPQVKGQLCRTIRSSASVYWATARHGACPTQPLHPSPIALTYEELSLRAPHRDRVSAGAATGCPGLDLGGFARAASGGGGGPRS